MLSLISDPTAQSAYILQIGPFRVRLSASGRRQLLDHAITFGTEIAVLGSAVLVLKLAAWYWGQDGFGQFLLARRTIGLLQLPALCGMALGLTRFVAFAHARDPAREWNYLDAALMVTGITTLVAVAILLGLDSQLAGFLLGNVALTSLVQAIAPCVVGLVFHGLCYGFLRGRLHMVQANIFQAVNLGIVPLILFSWPGLSVSRLMLMLGTTQSLVAIGTLGWIRLRGPRPMGPRALFQDAGKEMLWYGAPRVPGEFFLGALGTAPVTAAAHLADAAAAGRIGLGMALVTLVSSLFAPLGQVMLPSISGRVANGRTTGLAREVYLITAICAGLTLLCVGLLEVIAPWLLVTVFGPTFVAAVTPVRVVLLGAVPYVCYVVCRNVLDAIHAAPLNAVNLLAALLGLGVVIGTGRTLSSVAPAVVVSMTILGTLTLWRTRNALNHLASQPSEVQS